MPNLLAFPGWIALWAAICVVLVAFCLVALSVIAMIEQLFHEWRRRRA